LKRTALFFVAMLYTITMGSWGARLRSDTEMRAWPHERMTLMAERQTRTAPKPIAKIAQAAASWSPPQADMTGRAAVGSSDMSSTAIFTLSSIL